MVYGKQNTRRMNKTKLFAENFLVYGLGGIISKVIPFVMLPVIARLMPDTEYFGISDLTNTMISLFSALAVMGMYDAMYRMFFEKDDAAYKKDICSTALVFTLITSVLVFVFMILFQKQIAACFFGSSKYVFLVCIAAAATLAGASNSIVCAPSRMQNKRKVFLVTNTLAPVLSYSVSVPLLLAGHYMTALPAAALISGILMEMVFLALNRRWFDVTRFRADYLKQMLAIAVPMLPNFLIYWVFHSCDRLMITHYLGAGEAGVYSIGSKLGSASQLIYTAFAGGWQYFAFSTMKEDSQVQTNARIFEYLGMISFTCTMFVCVCSQPLYRILFTGDYTRGYIAAPYLFLAPLLQMLFQVACSQFLVVKKTWPNLFILSGGAAVNVVLNRILIPVIGIEGAAAATLSGYVAADVAAVFVLCRMKLMIIRRQFLAAVSILAGFLVFWRFAALQETGKGLAGAAVCTGIFLLLYRKDILEFKNRR